MTGLTLFLIFLALLISLPAWGLLLLAVAAGRMPARPAGGTAAGPREICVAVLVPAHNESSNVLPTIACLLPQMRGGDRLVVVADNCTDNTAQLARDAGATVLERHDASLRGKGYALAFGVDYLRSDPPQVVMVVDADCTVSADAVDQIAMRCMASGAPVQMLNLMHAGTGAGVRLRILEFAMVVKNLVRPLGSYKLGGACHLMGTGMALPWGLMSEARLATGHIAEDMKLGVDLALAGHPTQFFVNAAVSSAFPDDSQTARVQKSRWEHGHLTTLREELPRILHAAIRTRKPALFVLAVDLMIPPLALYALVLGSALGLFTAGSFFWPALLAPSGLLAMATLALAGAVGLAWLRYGQHLLSMRELLFIPLYAIWKIPVYVAYALRKRSGWVRTKRKSE